MYTPRSTTPRPEPASPEIPCASSPLPPSSEPSSPLTALRSSVPPEEVEYHYSSSEAHQPLVLLDDLDDPLSFQTLGVGPASSFQHINQRNNQFITPQAEPHWQGGDAPALGRLEVEYSTDHVQTSSPIQGKNKAERSAARQRKVVKHREKEKRKREAAQAQAKVNRAEAARVAALRKEAEHHEAEHKAAGEKCAAIKDVLSYMKGKDVTYGDILLFMSDTDASSGYGDARYRGLFAIPGRARQILNNWVSSSNSETGRAAVQDWALDYIGSLVSKEASAATSSHVLHAFQRPVDESFAGNFKFTTLYADLYKRCPRMRTLLSAFSTTVRQRNKLASLVSSGQTSAAIKYEARRNKVRICAPLTSSIMH